MRDILMKTSAVVLVAVGVSTHAGERETADVSAAQVEALIEKLVRPKDWDKLSDEARSAAKREMIKTWLELRDLGPPAFPTLVEHFDDKRTSFTADSGSTDETWTVGRACFDAIRCNLEPFNGVVYSSCIPPEKYWWRPNYCREFLSPPEKAQQWMAAHTDKSLVALQIEALEWVTTNRSKRLAEISEEDRKSLFDELAKLKKDRKPLKAGVPWSR